MVFDAIQQALDTKPEGVTWFWWNATFCPILPNDKNDSLYNRWSEWREAYQKGALLSAIESFYRQSVTDTSRP